MRLRLLAALPLPLAAAAVLLVFALAPTGGRPGALAIVGLAAKGLAALGAVAAAVSFGRRSRLRVAWLAIAASYAVLAVKSAPVFHEDLAALQWGTLAANLLAPAGALLMVRAWYASGLTPAIPVLRRRVLPVLAFAVALAVTGPGVLVQVRALARDPFAVLLVFSGIGDIACITLLAPLLLIAHAMRGGRLAWPWALLAAGELCWLLYDLVPSLSPALLSSAAVARALGEVLRVGACLFQASAGLAQGLALRSPRLADARTVLEPR